MLRVPNVPKSLELLGVRFSGLVQSRHVFAFTGLSFVARPIRPIFALAPTSALVGEFAGRIFPTVNFPTVNLAAGQLLKYSSLKKRNLSALNSACLRETS